MGKIEFYYRDITHSPRIHLKASSVFESSLKNAAEYQAREGLLLH
jgi:hypothetical protein